PGDVQRMSAGSGIRHSEFNPSQVQPVHFLQIWIQPDRLGIAPSYEEKHFEQAEKRGRLRLIASADGTEGSVRIRQDARVYAGLFDGEEQAALSVDSSRRVYVHVARGAVEVNGIPLSSGDALKLFNETGLKIAKGRVAEVLVFDLPGRD